MIDIRKKKKEKKEEEIAKLTFEELQLELLENKKRESIERIPLNHPNGDKIIILQSNFPTN